MSYIWDITHPKAIDEVIFFKMVKSPPTGSDKPINLTKTQINLTEIQINLTEIYTKIRQDKIR